MHVVGPSRRHDWRYGGLGDDGISEGLGIDIVHRMAAIMRYVVDAIGHYYGIGKVDLWIIVEVGIVTSIRIRTAS